MRGCSSAFATSLRITFPLSVHALTQQHSTQTVFFAVLDSPSFREKERAVATVAAVTIVGRDSADARLMNASLPLFRPAAVAANRRDALGPIVLSRPVSFGVLTAVALLIGLLLGALLAFGAYSA